MMNMNTAKLWLKQSQNPCAKVTFKLLKEMVAMSLPAPKIVVVPLYHGVVLSQRIWATLTRILWWTPIFKGRLAQVGKGLFLYGGMPYISGPLTIMMGDHCRLSGQATLSGRLSTTQSPTLILGDNIDIGWQTTIAVGTTVVIGDHVRIAGRAFLAGYPGHPIAARARAEGLPDHESQVGDIILEQDVWLATGVMVMGKVRIGRGTIVAAGSVVTCDLPPNVLAAGVPAKVIRTLTEEEMSR